MGTAGTHADAEATPTLGGLFHYNKGYNGTTWDYLRTAITTVSSTLTGFLTTLPWALYHSSPVTRTNGQGGPLETDATGNLRTAEASAAQAEDNTVGVFKVEQRFSATNMTTATTTTIKSGAGLLHAIIVNKAIAAATISLFDNTAGSGTSLGVITFGAALLTDPPLNAIYDVSFSTGLTVTTSGATNITLVWR